VQYNSKRPILKVSFSQEVLIFHAVEVAFGTYQNGGFPAWELEKGPDGPNTVPDENLFFGGSVLGIF